MGGGCATRAPTEGYGEAIVLPEINADHFEIKTNLLQLVQANPFHGLENKNPHAHINSFKRITSTLRFRNVSNDVIKLMMFPYSLEGDAKTWESVSKTDERIDKLADQLSTLVEIVSKKVVTPALIKAVEETCVTCGGAHSWYNCPATDNNQASVCVTTVEWETEETTDKEQSNFQGSAAQIPPPVTPIPTPKPDVPKTLPKTTPIPEPDLPKSLPKPNIPYPSRRDDQKSRDKASNQKEKIFQIFQDLRFNISFADALLLMPGGLLLKKLPEKLGDPDKFLILCNFPGMDLSLPDLTPTRMTLELADRSITHPKGLAEDVYVKVGKFYFPTDFVVVDFKADPRVPLILRRSFLRTGRALIDVYGEEITLRVDNEAVTFNLDQTTRYSSTNDKSVNRIDIIDAVCEEYAPELLGFSSGGNPAPTSEPFTSEFILEEIEAYLKGDSISSEIDYADCNPEEDICLIEKLLNNDPFQLPPMDLKQSEITKAKSSIEEPLELELKDLPSHLEYAYLEENDKLPVIIAKVPWVSPVHCVPKKGGITVVANEENELIPTCLVTGWRVCIDYRKLNEATRKNHFPLPFMDQMLEILAGNEFYYFLDRFSGYFQILIDPQDQEKTTFTCPYGTFAYRRMPFGSCNAPGTFQRCMMAIFHDMIEKTVEVFMDDFSDFGDSFYSCLSKLEKMLKRCEDTNLVLNWEKCLFMCREGIVLGHKISKSGIKVDRAKVDVIAKLPHPTTVKGVRSFLGHAGFYRRFIQDFSKIARLMTHLLEKETPFVFSKDCIDAFQTLKKKLTEAPILVVPDWNLPFELMCDASDFAIGAVLGQRRSKHFQPIHYASTDIKEMDKNKDKADKTEHKNEKSARKRVQRVTSLSRDWKLIENTSCASALSMKWTNNSLTHGYGKIYIFKFISSQVAKEICWLIFDAYKTALKEEVEALRKSVNNLRSRQQIVFCIYFLLMSLTHDGDFKSVVDDVKEYLRQICVNEELKHVSLQTDMSLQENDCRDVHISPDVSSDTITKEDDSDLPSTSISEQNSAVQLFRKLRPKRSTKRRKLFKTCCMNWGEVNPVHAYYNGSRTSKDNEDPSWNTSFKTWRTQKTNSALEAL
ncbi:reverse transcriptase domain-containing protein [Tanacetum coccineum]